jgi:hypothetical protein
MVLINVQLPEAVEEKARAAGLLTSEKIGELIEAELERQRQSATVETLEMMDRVSAKFRAEYSHLTEDEALEMLNEWIDEARAEQAGNENGSST